MSAFTKWDILTHRLDRVRAGLDTPWEFLLLLLDHASLRLGTVNPARAGMIRIRPGPLRWMRDDARAAGSPWRASTPP